MKDQDGEFDDWIELANVSKKDVDLSGMYLSDSRTKLDKWAFPVGTKIKAGEYLLVWADNDLKQKGLHAGFKLSSSDDRLWLVKGKGDEAIIADEFKLQHSKADLSCSRAGKGKPKMGKPTPGKKNTMVFREGDQ